LVSGLKKQRKGSWTQMCKEAATKTWQLAEPHTFMGGYSKATKRRGWLDKTPAISTQPNS